MIEIVCISVHQEDRKLRIFCTACINTQAFWMCLVRSSRVPGRGRMLLGFHTTLELLHHLRARTSISPTGGLSRRQHICMRRQHKSTHANTRQLQTCVQALKSRLVLKAKQSSMARYLSSHPERRMTLSTTCTPVRSEQRGPNRTRSDAPRMKPLPPKQALTSSSSAGGPAPLAITQATSSPHFFHPKKGKLAHKPKPDLWAATVPSLE